MDVVQRLEPVVIEIERERECVCVVAHQAILRAIYGYFTKTPLKARGTRRAARALTAARRTACWTLQLAVLATRVHAGMHTTQKCAPCHPSHGAATPSGDQAVVRWKPALEDRGPLCW